MAKLYIFRKPLTQVLDVIAEDDPGANVFVRRDGTTPLTGNWNVGGFDITGIGSLEAVDAIISGNLTTGAGRYKNKTRYTTTQAIPVTDHEVFCNTDGSAWTATLPVGIDEQEFRIINTGSSNNLLTVAPNGAEHLLGANENWLLFDGETLIVVYDATDGWY